MPRVTYETYRQRHQQLLQLWTEHQGLFVLVDPMEQWALHEYFLCADRPTETELHAHYAKLREQGSSLANRAGKAYAELMRRIDAGQPVQARVKAAGGRKGKVLTVRCLVKPQIDVDDYIATVMQIVDRIKRDEPTS